MMDSISIIISGIVLCIAIVGQVIAFSKTQQYRHKLKSIFPDSPEEDLSTEADEDNASVQVVMSDERSMSDVFRDIVSAINNYLKKNQGATDFSTLKDITDRQSDAIESQISAIAPVPIYIGLCGTVTGIVLGVYVLAFCGGLDSLLTVADTAGIHAVTDETSVAPEIVDYGAQGIKTLLQGVGVAMVSTLMGVLLTIVGSFTHKNSARQNESKKNRFLNWMQGELLPQMKHGMASTINILQKNLTKFNKDFSSNSQELNKIFHNINTTYKENSKLLEAVQRLDVDAMANANVRVLQELKSCTGEINDLHSFLAQSNRYLVNVESLNSNLSEHLDRTKLIENMASFFQKEVEQISARKDMIANAVAEVDCEVQESIKGLSRHTNHQYTLLEESTATQHSEFMKAVEAQQTALNRKLEETSVIIDELRNLTAVKDSLGHMAEAMTAQNEKMDRLSDLGKGMESLISLSRVQGDKLDSLTAAFRHFAENGIHVQTVADMPVRQSDRKVRMPVWAVVLSSFTSVAVVGTCVIYILNLFNVL